MTDNFYRAFEEKHRGSRDLIKSRLSVYLPFVSSLLKTYPNGTAVDLGCGRGEWLELLREHGFDAQGVDLDDGMLEVCLSLGLKGYTGDALAFLRDLRSESQVIVSGFHIVEHLPFELVRQLVIEAKRVLKPGGLLIFETPNPENITVGTNSFYLDPTHQRPIPPELLIFLPEHYGFKRSKVLRLQEQPGLANRIPLSLWEVLGGVSPDYAMVAQTEAPPSTLQGLDSLFDKEYGLNLQILADRYQRQLSDTLVHAESRAEQAIAKAQQAETTAQQAETRAQQAETTAQQAETTAQQAETTAQQAEATAQQAEAKAQQVEAVTLQALKQLNAIYSSTSWRITAPIRSSKKILSGSLVMFSRATRIARDSIARVPSARRVYHLTQDPVGHGIRYVVRRPRLKRTLHVIIRWFPFFEGWLVERRAAQVRADFSRDWSDKELGLARRRETDTTLSFSPDLHKEQRNVDEILGRIRAELYPPKGDQ